MVTNTFGVRPSVWKRWTARGRGVFNTCYQQLSEFPGVTRWNAAFAAACVASGLHVEFK